MFGRGEAESITEQRGRGVWLLREMQQYYLSAFAHPAEAGTGSNLASLGASQCGSGVILFPQHRANSHCISDGVKTPLLPAANNSAKVRNDSISLDVSQIPRDSGLGLNMKAGETAFTNELLMPREAKWFSQSEDKGARCDNYPSVTALITLACAHNSLGISTKTRWVPGGALILYMLAPRRGRCCTDPTNGTLRSKDLQHKEGAPSVSVSLGRKYILGVLGRRRFALQCSLPTTHIPGQKVPCTSKQPSTRLCSCIF